MAHLASAREHAVVEEAAVAVECTEDLAGVPAHKGVGVVVQRLDAEVEVQLTRQV